MNESPDLISCPKCSRPILRHAVKEHLESCGLAKETGKQVGSDKDKTNGNGKGTPNGEIAVMPPKSKKRKHDEGSPLALCTDVDGLAESVNGETTPPKKKSAKRDKEESETPKKEKKKKPKPTVTKPKRMQTPPRPMTRELMTSTCGRGETMRCLRFRKGNYVC